MPRMVSASLAYGRVKCGAVRGDRHIGRGLQHPVCLDLTDEFGGNGRTTTGEPSQSGLQRT